MTEWNVVVSLNPTGFREAFRVLPRLGRLSKTEFFNVLVMKVADIGTMLETLRERLQEDPRYLSFLSRLMPVTHTFTFLGPEEFDRKATETVLAWLPDLAGKSFHVRIHRRGFKGRISSPEEERSLDRNLLESLGKAGTPGRITFEDPEATLVIETIGTRAGLSLWRREDLERYPFLRPDS